MCKTIGERIKRFRKNKKFTQAQLAQKIGMSVQSIVKIEHGTNHPNSITVDKLSEALEVSPNEIHGTYDYGMPFNYQLPFARNIKFYREDTKMTIEKLAEQTNLEVEMIKKIEKGSIIPSKNILEKITHVLGISEKELIKDDNVKRSIKEIDLIEAIEYRKSLFEKVHNISDYKLAQAELINAMKLEEKSLEELKNIFDMLYEKEIYKHVKEF